MSVDFCTAKSAKNIVETCDVIKFGQSLNWANFDKTKNIAPVIRTGPADAIKAYYNKCWQENYLILLIFKRTFHFMTFWIVPDEINN